MTIRAAKADDIWRKVFSRQYPNRYESLGFEGLFCLGKGSVRFSGGISAIVGGNGVGKSTLAAALGELLETELAERFVAERSRLHGSILSGVIKEGATQKNRAASGGNESPRQLNGDPLAVESWWLDAGLWAYRTRAQIVHDPNFSDVIEPVSPKVLSPEELERLSYVVGKVYESCSIFEIAEYAGFDRFPYFLVCANGIEYGSEGMGQGELALMLTLWVLNDLRPGSILILEEPECHVSPRSQAALVNVIAEAAANKGIWTIITTHSPIVASRIPTEHLRLLVREGTHVKVLDSVHRHEVATVLGGGLSFGGIALVEDDVAQELTVAILEEFAPDLLRQLEIIPAGGESRVSAALAAFPRSRRWFRLIGVLDGDQRGRMPEHELHWPLVYLPGSTDPAHLLKRSIDKEGALDRLSSELRVERRVLLATINAFMGAEPRDWIVEVVRALVTTKTALVRALFRVWVEAPDCRAAACAFVNEITSAYDRCECS